MGVPTVVVARTDANGAHLITSDIDDNDTITDAVGNPLGGPGEVNGDFTGGESYTLDRTPPTVDSIALVGSNPTDASSVTFTVTFTEDVWGVDTSDFAVTTGLSDADIYSVTGSGDTWTVE